ncbi:helix-turn-helix domain-containing protein, partial [Acinetobacter sp. YH16053]|uniref:helix-turn-helix domain-containing protein n=1 Tax=Acinetobacter sp. YH16053 TaxID=2601192 RepID=UPI0015D44F8D
RVTFWSEQAYTLDYLADFVELPKKLSKKQEVSGLGRNCTMFDTVRKWAYKAIRAHRGGIYTTWLDEVVKHCLSVNEAFLEALPYSEIKATAKGIATYCWKKDAYCYQEFIDRQSRKGKLGGLKGGKIRSDNYASKRVKALAMMKEGMTQKQIATELMVTDRTIRNWIKNDV